VQNNTRIKSLDRPTYDSYSTTALRNNENEPRNSSGTSKGNRRRKEDRQAVNGVKIAGALYLQSSR